MASTVRPLGSLSMGRGCAGLTPGPIQQNRLSRSRPGPSRPVTCSYSGTKNVSTRPGPKPDMGALLGTARFAAIFKVFYRLWSRDRPLRS